MPRGVRQRYSRVSNLFPEERRRERCIMLTFQTVLQAVQRSSQERTYESRQQRDDTVCVDTLNVSTRRELSTGEDSIIL